MADDAVKKAAEMLLGGARMVSEPCPYCKGVRVMKGGHAFCSSCQSEPDASRKAPGEGADAPRRGELEARLVELTGRLSAEGDAAARKEILGEIASITAKIAEEEGS